MAHTRTQIRNAMKALILPIPAFSGRVFASRFANLQLSEMPSVVIYSLQEPVENADIHDLLKERNLTVNVSIKAKAVTALDTLLDDLAELVETEIDADLSLGNTVKSVSLLGTTIDINEDSEVPLGEALLQYQITYYTQVGAPDQFA